MLRVPVLYVLLFKLHPAMGKKAPKCKNHVHIYKLLCHRLAQVCRLIMHCIIYDVY